MIDRRGLCTAVPSSARAPPPPMVGVAAPGSGFIQDEVGRLEQAGGLQLTHVVAGRHQADALLHDRAPPASPVWERSSRRQPTG